VVRDCLKIFVILGLGWGGFSGFEAWW